MELRGNPSGGAAIPSTSYLTTRDGFTLLAMGFTGAKALSFKLAYIDAFNAMAAHFETAVATVPPSICGESALIFQAECGPKMDLQLGHDSLASGMIRLQFGHSP